MQHLDGMLSEAVKKRPRYDQPGADCGKPVFIVGEVAFDNYRWKPSFPILVFIGVAHEEYSGKKSQKS